MRNFRSQRDTFLTDEANTQIVPENYNGRKVYRNKLQRKHRGRKHALENDPHFRLEPSYSYVWANKWKPLTAKTGRRCPELGFSTSRYIHNIPTYSCKETSYDSLFCGCGSLGSVPTRDRKLL